MNISSIGTQIRFTQNNAQNKVQTAPANKAPKSTTPEALKVSMLKIMFDTYTNEEIEQINKTRLLPKDTKSIINYGPNSVRGYRIVPLSPIDSREQRYLPDGYNLQRIYSGAVFAIKNPSNQT